jgi:hypothetical protein
VRAAAYATALVVERPRDDGRVDTEIRAKDKTELSIIVFPWY